MAKEDLALLGGEKSVKDDYKDIFRWPVVTKEDEEAVLEVLRRGSMSGNDITLQFEKEYAGWAGTEYALAYPNGTDGLRAAMWASGVGAGDEIICPSLTYWASCAQALTLGAAVNFADIDPDTLTIDINDIEHRIGPRTRAIVAVHYASYPCDMDPIMKIAENHNLKVIEDVSHAHGGMYKGKMLGSIGDCAGMSLMSGKSLAVGEGGMLTTNSRTIYERCIAYGFYERTSQTMWADYQVELHEPELKKFAGLPLGGYKHRINQTAAAMGRVQLRNYPSRRKEILKAMNRFWDMLDGTPGIKAHRPPENSGLEMGGWYTARGLYREKELGGLPLEKFCEALRAEGFPASPGANSPLHLHPVFHEADIFRQGKPTMISFGQRDVRQGPGSLPVTEKVIQTVFSIPWFKKDAPDVIAEYVNAVNKVAANADRLVKEDR